jgi:hypothetical protein
VDLAALRSERLRSHRLTAPAASVLDAATHMLAVQSQEFWGGRWALAQRTRPARRGTRPTMREVDAMFDSGDLVRAWTMRGTLHTIPARDLRWVLEVTGERQLKQAAPRHRALGLDADVMGRAERVIRHVLGGGQASRPELFAELEKQAGIDPRDQRGVHILYALAVQGLICQGPVVERATGITRDQRFVMVDDWVRDAASPADPLAELFRRYIDGHGPAGPDDFAWWAGLPVTVARQAAAASGLDTVELTGGARAYVSSPRPRRSGTTEVFALPPFEEYFISYADRTVPCAPEFLAPVGPGSNGMVRPILVARGEIVGVWTPFPRRRSPRRRPRPRPPRARGRDRFRNF